MSGREKEDRISRDWFTSAFGELYPIIYAHRTVEAARPEALFAVEQVALTATDTALDLCCGNGRHMVTLREHCPGLTGLDYSPDLLVLAAEKQQDTALVRGDMRALPFSPAAFDVVFNFFTSFGYFQTQQENQSVVNEAGRVLKPGGRFFIDYLNPEQVEKTLQPLTERTAEGLSIREERWIDHQARRVNKTITVTRGCEQLLHAGESVRLYTLEEMKAMLHDAGLEIHRVFGNYEGVPFSGGEPRMILTGSRKEIHA